MIEKEQKKNNSLKLFYKIKERLYIYNYQNKSKTKKRKKERKNNLLHIIITTK